MDEKQKKLIEEQIKRIPSEVREAISSSNWERTIFDIGREHKMHIDDIDILSIETILTMIGLEHPKDYAENLRKRIDLKEEELLTIVEEVNKRLFSKVLEALRIYYKKITSEGLIDSGIKDDYKQKPKTIKIAGVTMGDNLDDDNEEITENEIKKDTQPEEEIVPIKEEKTVTEEKPVSVDSSKPVSGVFQTQTKTISNENNKNLDPYREPIE